MEETQPSYVVTCATLRLLMRTTISPNSGSDYDEIEFFFLDTLMDGKLI